MYADILFDRQILKRVLESPHEITLVIDRAYQTLPPRNKELDLVMADDESARTGCRNLNLNTYKRILRVGKNLDGSKANYEFIGMALFREEGSKKLLQAWDRASREFKNSPFYEAETLDQASFTDLLQYLVDEPYPIYGMEIEHGWSEIHSLEDVERLDAYFKSKGLPVVR